MRKIPKSHVNYEIIQYIISVADSYTLEDDGERSFGNFLFYAYVRDITFTIYSESELTIRLKNGEIKINLPEDETIAYVKKILKHECPISPPSH